MSSGSFSKSLCPTTHCHSDFAAVPMLNPSQVPGQRFSPKNFLSTHFFGVFLPFFKPPNMLLQQPQHFIGAQGNIHLQFSCSMETHLAIPARGVGEDDPTTPCLLEQGVHPSWAKMGGWEVMWRDPLGSEEHPKKPLQ